MTGPSGIGFTGPTGPASIGTNVVASYYNTNTFGITGPGSTGTVFSYNQTAVELGGIQLIGSTQIRVPKSGVYEAWYSLQTSYTGGGTSEYLYIWLRINGIDVDWTNGRIEVNSNNGDSLPIVPYIISLNEGDTIEFVAEGTNGDFLGLAQTGVPGPDIPSVIVGIKQVAVDIGTTGPTGKQGNPGGSFATSYGSFSSSTNQLVGYTGATGASTPLTYDTTEIFNGVSIGVPSSRVVISTAGVYRISYSVQLTKSSVGTQTAYVWTVINGTALTRSTAVLTLETQNGYELATGEHIYTFATNDYFEVYFTSNNSDASAVAIPAFGDVPEVPSIVTNVYRIG
jgi:hypothetical protein